MKKTLFICSIVIATLTSSTYAQIITAGNAHALAICLDSTVKAWGDGYYGNLGNGTTLINTPLPVPVTGLTGVVSTSAGFYTSAAIKSDGTLWTWGRNNYGQLGQGDLLDDSVPEQVTSLTGIAAVSCGTYHTLILKNNTVYACGYGANGRLGDGSLAIHTNAIPTQVLALPTTITAVSAGWGHSLALSSDSTVWAWGFGTDGELGDGSSTDSPVALQVPGLSGVIAISAGDSYSLALKADGTVWAWGDNNYYELGDSTFTLNQPSPVQVAVLNNIVKISRNRSVHTFAIKDDGTVWGWGDNQYGNLGVGDQNTVNYPRQITALSHVKEAVAGEYFSLFFTPDTSWSVGINNGGQLGDSTLLDSASLGAVQNLCRLLTSLAASVSSTDITCFSSNDGVASAIVTGGAPPYTYNWSTSETTSTITALSAGSYTVTVTDADGTIVIEQGTVTEPPVLTAGGSTIADVLCFSGTDGSAIVIVAGGTPSYSYQWSPAGGNSDTASNLIAGDYTVTVTDLNGCSTTATASITEPPVLTSAISVSTDVLCNGSNEGSAYVTAGGGTVPYTYEWSPIGGNADTASSLAANTYTVTVTDANGCSTTSTAVITEPSALTSVISVSTDVSCSGNSDGSAYVTASGGTLPYTYEWSPIGGNVDTASNLIANTYTVTVTDGNGCSITSTAVITEPAVLTANGSAVNNVSCNGNSDGAAYATVGGGTLPYTYEWSPIGGNSDTASNLTPNTYTVTVTDGNGCSITSTAVITEPAVLTANGSTVNNVSCNGSNEGSAYVTAGGGTLPYTYEWSPLGGNSDTASNLIAGDYTVTVTDANGCSITSTAVITEPSALTSVISVLTNVTCNGNNDGSAYVIASGGTLVYTYAWSPSGGNGQTANNLSANTYIVIVTDANGCATSSSVAMTEPSLLTAVISDSTDASCSTCSDGSATVDVVGGTGSYTYSWSPAGGNGATASNLLPGNYTVCVTDTNGCSVCQSVLISYPTAVNELLSTNTFSIHPNPAHYSFTVSLNKKPGIRNDELKIFDMTGREVYQQEISTQLSTVNCQLSEGVYFVKVSNGEKTYTQKLVIQ
jgi:alpha-tubulin suppressor-like RCC1 family protein